MKTEKTITADDKDSCRIITPEFRLSYPHLFKAQAPKGTDKLKFSITMLFPKTSKITGSSAGGSPVTLTQILTNAKNVKWGSKEEWPKNLISPVADGDDEKYADKQGYAGCWVIKASTGEDTAPSVVGPDMLPITKASDVYPGCYARAYIYAYGWEFMGKYGVSFILDHVQKLRDGKSFGGKRPVEQVFGVIEAQEDTTESEGEENFL